MAIKTFKRKEIKFLLNINQFNELLNTIDLYMNPDEYCVGGKEYGIFNIYYDTNDSFLIRESLSKPYYKEKLRVRTIILLPIQTIKSLLKLRKKSAVSLLKDVQQ